jgi:hypothetical protein
MAFQYSYEDKEIPYRQTIADMDQKHYFCPCKLADLRFADWDTKQICGFAICGFAICVLIITNLRISDLRTGTPQKFAAMQ